MKPLTLKSLCSASRRERTELDTKTARELAAVCEIADQIRNALQVVAGKHSGNGFAESRISTRPKIRYSDDSVVEPGLVIESQTPSGTVKIFAGRRDALILVSRFLGREAPAALRSIEQSEILALGLFCAMTVTELRAQWPGLFLVSVTEAESSCALRLQLDVFQIPMELGYLPDTAAAQALRTLSRFRPPNSFELLRGLMVEAQLIVPAETTSLHRLVNAAAHDRWHVAQGFTLPAKLRIESGMELHAECRIQRNKGPEKRIG